MSSKSSPSIVILCTGEELLDGRVVNTNLSDISLELRKKGWGVKEALVIGDASTVIQKAVSRYIGHCDFLITTGGIGPTDDDRTLEAVALACNADLKADTQPIPNSNGVNGIMFECESTTIMTLPGVPSEMRLMLSETVIPLIEKKFASLRVLEHTLTCIGIPEKQLHTLLQDLYPLPTGIQIAYQIPYPYVVVRLQAIDPDSHLESTFLELKNTLQDRLKTYICAENKGSLAQSVLDVLHKKGLKLSVAESCTSGLVSDMIATVPGASDNFMGSIICYHNLIKTDLLKIPEDIIQEEGAVSAICAEGMAEQSRDLLSSDIGLAVTGIAGPEGGSEEKPVGLVFIACSTLSGTHVQELTLKGNREQIRKKSACLLLKLALDVISDL